MEKQKLIVSYLIASLIFFINCKANTEKTNNNTEKLPRSGLNFVNETSTIKKDNVIEISQTFSKENNLISRPIEVDLSLTSGAMISAYSEYNDNYKVSYKTLENNSWSDWIELRENKEVNNPDRKVFSPKSLNNSVKQILFKSNKIIKSKIIFRIYTFQKK